jgi:hypothetical protein
LLTWSSLRSQSCQTDRKGMTVHPDRQIAKLSDDWTKDQRPRLFERPVREQRYAVHRKRQRAWFSEQTPKHTHAVVIKSVGSLQNQHNVP